VRRKKKFLTALFRMLTGGKATPVPGYDPQAMDAFLNKVHSAESKPTQAELDSFMAKLLES
jgi:hypothetical protein